MNTKISFPLFWATLNRIQVILSLPDAFLCRILELTPKQFNSAREKKGSLPLFSIMRLSEFLEVGFVPLMTGDVDYRVLTAKILNGTPILPERYRKAAFAKRRVSIYMLDYITAVLGEVHRHNLLKHLQVSEELFKNPDGPINILFTLDLCEHLKKYRLMDDEALIKMGRFSSQSAKSPLILNPLKKVKSVKEIYEVMCTELLGKYFEKNYSYRLDKASKDRSVVIGLPNLEIEDQLGIKNAGSRAVCALRSGFGSSFPEYLNLPFAKVRKTACVHDGDTECRYEFDYEYAQHVLSHPETTPVSQDLWLN